MATQSNITVQSETARVNYVEYVGDTLCMKFAYKDGSSTGPLIDLSGYTLFMEVRKMDTSGVPIGDALLVRSSDNGTILLGEAAGVNENICVTLESVDTTTLGAGDFGYFIVATQVAINYVNTLIRGKLVLKIR